MITDKQAMSMVDNAIKALKDAKSLASYHKVLSGKDLDDVIDFLEAAEELIGDAIEGLTDE